MTAASKEKRPWGVTVLLALVLMFTVVHVMRVGAAARSWQLLSSLPLSVPPAYLLLSALLWVIVGAILAYGLFKRSAWARRSLQTAAAAYALFFWGDKLLAQARGPQDSNWVFLAFLGLLWLGSLFALLASPDVKAYFARQTAIGVKDDKTLKD